MSLFHLSKSWCSVKLGNGEIIAAEYGNALIKWGNALPDIDSHLPWLQHENVGALATQT